MQSDEKSYLMSFKDPIDKKHNPGSRVERKKDCKILEEFYKAFKDLRDNPKAFLDQL
jgi:hypothetical protein